MNHLNVINLDAHCRELLRETEIDTCILWELGIFEMIVIENKSNLLKW